jgi:signal transduction histidine kinase
LIASRIQIQEKHNLSEVHIPESLKVLIYRFFQEALNNISKHSRADRVQVSLNKVDHSLELEIEDNGIRFDFNEILSRKELEKGAGLASMKERAKLSGGTFFIDSDRGIGKKIRIVWPLMK